MIHEDFQVYLDSDWVGDLLERKSKTGVIVRSGIKERAFDVKRKQDHVRDTL